MFKSIKITFWIKFHSRPFLMVLDVNQMHIKCLICISPTVSLSAQKTGFTIWSIMRDQNANRGGLFF
jgi:hypothetical protein